MIDLKYDIENSGGAEFGPDMEPNVLPEVGIRGNSLHCQRYYGR